MCRVAVSDLHYCGKPDPQFKSQNSEAWSHGGHWTLNNAGVEAQNRSVEGLSVEKRSKIRTDFHGSVPKRHGSSALPQLFPEIFIATRTRYNFPQQWLTRVARNNWTKMRLISNYKRNFWIFKEEIGFLKRPPKWLVPEFIDPRFRENEAKTLVFSHWKRAFWACFREKWVYNFGHRRLFQEMTNIWDKLKYLLMVSIF
jgi:hypothetical protein